MIDISDTRDSASKEILKELRLSYDNALVSNIERCVDYWRSHRSLIALSVIEELNKRYSSKLKAIFEIQDFHASSAKILFALYVASEIEIIQAAEGKNANNEVHEAVVASYITRMQIADYILQSNELTNIMYFVNPIHVYKWVPECMLVSLSVAKNSINGIQSPEDMLSELRELLKDLSLRHLEQKTDVYFELSRNKRLRAELLVA